jgi:1-acyl-sn-glycerol-3-phosphate acyltransferase
MLSELLYGIGRIVITSYVHLMLKMDIRWHENMPQGPVLYAANHPSTTDPIFIHTLTRKPVSIMIHNRVFAIPFLGAYMKKMGHVRVIPGKGDEVLEEARRTLESGRSVVIFPEGLISPVNGFHEPRSGVARLALESKVPVVPLGIYLREKNCKRVSAMFEDGPDIVTWYLRGPYAITVGEALRFSGSANDRSLVKNVAENIMQHIRDLVRESCQRVTVTA